MGDNEKVFPWSEIKVHLSEKSQRELVALLGKCYKASPEVRSLLALAALEGKGRKTSVATDLKKMLHATFWATDRHEYPKNPELKEANRILSLARKTIGDPAILADLMLDHLEHGVGFTMKYGDMWEKYYTSIENQFGKTCEFIAAHSSEIDLKAALARIDKQIYRTRDIGWGFEETLDAIRDELLEKLEE